MPNNRMKSMFNQPNEKVVNVKASNEELVGKYANMINVNFTENVFVINFITKFSQSGVLAARMIIQPDLAKEFLVVLGKQIDKYEKEFGK